MQSVSQSVNEWIDDVGGSFLEVMCETKAETKDGDRYASLIVHLEQGGMGGKVRKGFCSIYAAVYLWSVGRYCGLKNQPYSFIKASAEMCDH